MSTDTYTRTEHAGRPHAGADARWQRMWSHRDHLLRVARRRSVSVEDAEDAVHEAMLRAAENPQLEDDRLGAWLTTVTMRLCVDRHRQVNRETDPRTWPRLIAPGPIPVDEAVCDRAEARWLARRSVELPARQAEALWLKSEDLDVGQVARKMGLSYRTVESLLARARRTLRNSLAATMTVACWLCARARTGGSGQAMAAASTAATLAVVGLALPHLRHTDPPRHQSPAASRPLGSERPGDPEAAASARPTATPNPAARAGTSAATARHAVPGVSLPKLPAASTLAVPSVPPTPVPSPPALSSVPSLPPVRSVPSVSVEGGVPVDPADAPTDLPSSPLPTSSLSGSASLPGN